MWEGNELQIDVWLNALSHLKERFYGNKTRIADIYVAADCEKTLSHGKIAVSQCALDQSLLREKRLELAPKGYPFEKRARLIEAREAERQRRVHMEVRIDKWRRNELAAGVDHSSRLRREAMSDGDDLAAGDGNVLNRTPVGKIGIGHEKVESHLDHTIAELLPKKHC